MERFKLIEIVRKYKIVFVGLGLIVGIFLLIAPFLFLFSPRSGEEKTKVQENNQQVTSDQIDAQNNITSIAKTNFQSFTYSSKPPQLPSSMTVYKLKTNYTLDEAKAFAQTLGLVTYKERNMEMFFYNKQETATKGWMLFDRQTGNFTYQSHAEGAVSGNAVPVQAANQFLTKIGMSDATITCPITYQQKGIDTVTFVECHRDWGIVGAPILNMSGLMNISENERIAQLKLGYVDAKSPLDASVINTSTGQDGKKRPDDFNTATIAVRGDGSILMVKSNLRRVSTSVPITNQADMITPEIAWKKFQSNQADVSLVLPSGSGTTDWKRIFPNNIATAKEAKVTDYTLVYLENSTNQEYLTPMYLVRGTAQTDSGYGIKFVQAVPATEMQLSSTTGMIKDVAGSSVYIAQGGNLQMQTFYLTATPAPNRSAGENRSAAERTSTSSTCTPSSDQLSPLSALTGVGTIGPWSIPPFHDMDGQGSYYLLPSADQAWPEVETIIESFGQLGFRRDAGINQDREVSDFSDDILIINSKQAHSSLSIKG